MNTLNEQDKKRLTGFLEEYWHESIGNKRPNKIFGFVNDCSCGSYHPSDHFEEQNCRTFTTWQDLGDLKDKLVEKGKYGGFFNFAFVKWMTNYKHGKTMADFHDWLINAPRFCGLVSEYLKGREGG